MSMNTFQGLHEVSFNSPSCPCFRSYTREHRYKLINNSVPYNWSFWEQGSPSRWGQRWAWGTGRSPGSGPWGGRWACRRWCCPSCRWARCCSGSPGCCGCGAGCSPAGPGLWRRSPPGRPERCGGTAARWWSPEQNYYYVFSYRRDTFDNSLRTHSLLMIHIQAK